jgi:hypothetical protein
MHRGYDATSGGIERMQKLEYLSLFAAAVTFIAAHGASGPATMQTAPTDPEHILATRFEFSSEDVRQARGGEPIARMIASQDRDELAVVGAVRLDGDTKRLVDWVRNVEHFRHAAELGLTRGIESPPAAQSFADLVLDAKDLAALRACRPGRCDLRVPDEVMATFQRGVAWDTPEGSANVNAVFAGMLTEYAAAYLHGGDAAAGNDFGALLRGAATLSELAPELTAYLQNFPRSKLAGVDQRFYWTNLTDTWGSIISLHHLVVYRRPSGDAIIADKTFYASRYFDAAAIVLSMHETPDGKGYYLIAGSRAKSSRLAGVGGRVLRGQVERAAAATVKMYLAWLRDSLATR